MILPAELQKSTPLLWSTGIGTDVWNLFCACISGDLQTVERLVNNDPSLVRSHYAYRTPIYFAVRENRLEVAAFLLDHGADPLSLAVNDSLLDICRDRGYRELSELLERQPDLAKRVSVAAKTRELTEWLFQRGMNPSQPDWLGITRLHEFARKGDLENAAIFIEHGAELHARDEDICSTPLAWAAKFGQGRMVELLLSRGAKPSLADDPPWATPIAWATRRGHDDIAELLKNAVLSRGGL